MATVTIKLKKKNALHVYKKQGTFSVVSLLPSAKTNNRHNTDHHWSTKNLKAFKL